MFLDMGEESRRNWISCYFVNFDLFSMHKSLLRLCEQETTLLPPLSIIFEDDIVTYYDVILSHSNKK